jgi:hypothetical protein
MDSDEEPRKSYRCVDDRVSLSATDLANNGRYLEIRDWVVAWKSDADMAFLDGHCLHY